MSMDNLANVLPKGKFPKRLPVFESDKTIIQESEAIATFLSEKCELMFKPRWEDVAMTSYIGSHILPNIDQFIWEFISQNKKGGKTPPLFSQATQKMASDWDALQKILFKNNFLLGDRPVYVDFMLLSRMFYIHIFCEQTDISIPIQQWVMQFRKKQTFSKFLDRTQKSYLKVIN